MDIECPSCGEPWDSYHLLYDEIHETDLPKHIKADFINGGGALDETTRQAFQASGWTFAGGSVLSFVTCPGCRPGNLLRDAANRVQERAAIASILEDDADALQVYLADHS